MATQEKGITFGGLGIQKGAHDSFAISQEKYPDELPILDISRYVTRGKLKMRMRLKVLPRAGRGRLSGRTKHAPKLGF